MRKLSLFEIFFLIVILILIIGFGIWVYLLKKPTTGVNCHTKSKWLWNKDCKSFQEKFYDATLKSPAKLKPYLLNFTHASGGGPSIFLPMWYRFRYVNVNTGGYSDFSDWIAAPVISGSCKLPCIKGVGKCEGQIIQGYDSCLFNQPTIGIAESDIAYDFTKALPNGDFVYINLHRYVGESSADATPPPPNAKDEIIGILAAIETIGGKKYYSMIDVLKNPCLSQSCNTPTWCQKQSKC